MAQQVSSPGRSHEPQAGAGSKTPSGHRGRPRRSAPQRYPLESPRPEEPSASLGNLTSAVPALPKLQSQCIQEVLLPSRLQQGSSRELARLCAPWPPQKSSADSALPRSAASSHGHAPSPLPKPRLHTALLKPRPRAPSRGPRSPPSSASLLFQGPRPQLVRL